ncbi:MAG: citrate synthase [Actinomycetales bacterium]
MKTANRLDSAPIEVPRGLANVIVTETELSEVRGREGFYNYRQYSATDLARSRSVEEVWHLLLTGELPDDGALAAFRGRLAAGMALRPDVAAALPAIAAVRGAGGLAGLRAALAFEASAGGYRPLYDLSGPERLADVLRLGVQVPVLIAALHRLRRGLAPVEPDPALDYAANYLYLLTGTRPRPEHARALGSYLSAAVDHGFNASTFTARVIASTGSDAASCILGALGALDGPLHGGAPSRALDALDAIGTPSNIEPWIRGELAAGRRIMGFGHPVYRIEDPRSRLLKEVAQSLGGARADFAVAVEAKVQQLLAELKPGRALHTNLEFYAAVVMESCGLDRELFTPTFAVARVLGWGANILEQARDGKIIRPSARYVGPAAPQPVPAR